MRKVGEAGKDEVVGGGEGHGNFSWKPRDSIANAFGAGLPDPNFVATIQIHSGSSVPAIGGMWGPSSALGRFVVHEDADARWCEGGPIVIEDPVKLRPGRELGIEARASQEVQRNDSLREDAVPQVKGKVFVDATQSSDKMILERPNCTLGSVASMHMRWN
jgi:hypothetical protein